MAKQELTLEAADALTHGSDRYWWDGWTLCYFTPGRGGGVVFRKDAMYNRNWPKPQKWGTLIRYPITDRGTYLL